jgi:phenylacetate-CoA ligase
MNHQSNKISDWESKRWSNFQEKLEKIHLSNSFQKKRFPELVDWKTWKSFDDFSEACPLTTKTELERDRLAYAPLGSNLTFNKEQYLRYSRTSGTSGEAISWMDTAEDWDWMLGNWDSILAHAGVRAGATCFFAFSFGPFLGFWTAYEATVQRGCICIPGGGQSTESRLRSVLDDNVEYLFCTPTYAMRMIETAKEIEIDLTKNSLKKIIVAGECGGSIQAVRRSVDEAWEKNSLIYDHYGMTEVGPVAYETPGGGGGLRVLLDSYHPEVIDPKTTRPVKQGELGELVLTPLGREGSPVLRYRTGDLVRVSSGMDESGLPTFDLAGGIIGRVDDMIVVRGVNLYPSGVDAIIRKFPGVSEYQVMVAQIREMNEISIRAECGEADAHKLASALQDAYSLRIPVVSVEKGTLPRYEMKANRWVRESNDYASHSV